MGLMNLDNVRDRLRIVGQSYGGVHPIPVPHIIGSLARDSDFDREFRPRLRTSQERPTNLRTAFPDGGQMPAIIASPSHESAAPTSSTPRSRT